MTVKKIVGVVWKVYFESMHDGSGVKEGRVSSCTVIADNVKEGIAKAEAAFPLESVHMIHGPDRLYETKSEVIIF